MPRTWRALPLTEGYDLLLKAPSHKAHLAQAAAGASYKPPKKVAGEIMTASVLIDALDDEGVRVPQGETYKLYRYAQGLAVELPSGYVVYQPLEGQKRNPSSGVANEDAPEGETPAKANGGG